MDFDQPKEQILTQMDPSTGNVLITIPAEIVTLLKWTADTQILYIANPESGSLVAQIDEKR